jgi:peptidoglycan/LPS O-acetylase OafA/YrhL
MTGGGLTEASWAADSNRYQTLDGLRGLGAIAVLLLHFGSSLGIPAPAHGYLAVDLFFCLSGFVLTRSYAGKIENGMSFEEWVCVRLIRLYPLYLLSIVLGAVAASSAGMPGSTLSPVGQLTAFGTGVLMIPSPTWNEVPEMFPFNFVAWSLSIELLLSLLFYWASRWRSRTLVALLLLGLCGLAIVRWRVGYVGGGFAWRDAPTGLARGLYGFSIGMLIARYQGVDRIRTHAAWLPMLAAGVMMWLALSHGVAYDLFAIVLVIPIIAYAAARLEPRKGNLFRHVGNLSYAVYALHNLSFTVLTHVMGIGSEHPGRLVGPVAFALFLVLCGLLDRYYDRPIRTALSSRIRARVERLAAP